MHDKDHTKYYVISKNGHFIISDFSKVQIGMSYYDVVNLMGEPTGTLGYGINSEKSPAHNMSFFALCAFYYGNKGFSEILSKSYN